MRIEAVAQASGLNGGPEVWVHVYSDEVLDWPRVEAKLNAGQAAMLESLGRRTLRYFPHTTTADEREEHGYTFEDFWVWSANKKGTQ